MFQVRFVHSSDTTLERKKKRLMASYRNLARWSQLMEGYLSLVLVCSYPEIIEPRVYVLVALSQIHREPPLDVDLEFHYCPLRGVLTCELVSGGS
jgi:hypothetical protein